MSHSLKKNTVLIFTILILAIVLLLPGLGRADVDEDFDWAGGLRTLKVCLEDANCPAGMEDSLKKAIDFWNDEGLSWTLEYVDVCDCTEQVKVECGTLPATTGGRWSSTGGTYGASTKNTVRINKDTDWGTCDDKHELVSILVHELGHCLRLNDVSGHSDVMQQEWNTAGHLYDPTTKDSTEAAQSDGTETATAETVPSGGKKATVYSGAITPCSGSNPFYLDEADGVMVFPFDPLSLLNVSAYIEGSESVHWSCDIAEGADLSEAFTLEIDYGDSTVNRQGYLSVVDPDWDETWMPTVVAPSDTSVPNENSMIILDATGSYHPAGLEAMDFQWWIDDGDLGVIKSQPKTSVFLPAGDHMIELRAQDDFGNWDSDMMLVDVGLGDVPTLTEWGLIILGLLLLTAGTVAVIRRRKAAMARTN